VRGGIRTACMEGGLASVQLCVVRTAMGPKGIELLIVWNGVINCVSQATGETAGKLHYQVRRCVNVARTPSDIRYAMFARKRYGIS